MKLFTQVRSLISTFFMFGLVLGMQACGGGSSAPSNAAPVFTSAATISVDENTTATGYTATATDAENSTVTFSLTGGTDQASLSIDSTTGVLSFIAEVNFDNPVDSDTNNSYVAEITATDGTNQTVQSVVVNVTNVLEATGHYDVTTTATVRNADDSANITITDMQAMIYNNRLIMLSKAQGFVYDGTMTLNADSTYTASVTVYSAGVLQSTATITGSVVENSSINGTLTSGTIGAGNGSFNLVYATSNNTVSDNSRILSPAVDTFWGGRLYGAADNFFYLFDVISPNSFEYVDGASVGTFDSCTFNGTITPVVNSSLYLINVTESGNCTETAVRNRVFTGFAVSRTDSAADDILIYAMMDAAAEYAVMTEAVLFVF